MLKGIDPLLTLQSNLQVLMGVGVGCGVGIGYGFGFGVGMRMDRQFQEAPAVEESARKERKPRRK